MPHFCIPKTSSSPQPAPPCASSSRRTERPGSSWASQSPLGLNSPSPGARIAQWLRVRVPAPACTLFPGLLLAQHCAQRAVAKELFQGCRGIFMVLYCQGTQMGSTHPRPDVMHRLCSSAPASQAPHPQHRPAPPWSKVPFASPARAFLCAPGAERYVRGP